MNLFIDNILSLSKRPLFRCLAFVILLTSSTRLTPLSFAVLDPDLWWHLQDGNWIIAHHAVPYHGTFTQYADRTWVAYSWGSEIILSQFYHWLGLVGLVGLRAGLEVMVTSILFLILVQGLGDFWKALALTATGMWAIHHCMGLQPMLFSILMFTVEIGLIWEAKRKKSVRPLFLLPLLFLVWANLHIQFIYGLFVLTLLVMSSMFCSILLRIKPSLVPQPDLPIRQLLAIWGFSVLATLVGPYSWRLYLVVLNYAQSKVPYNTIIELEALNFREAGHFVLVLIIAAAFLALGWRHTRDPFKLALLVICTVVAFRMMRDSWFVCIPALAIIADKELLHSPLKISRIRASIIAMATAAGTALVFTVVAWDSKITSSSLEQMVATNFPVRACDFIRTQSFPGPLYNDPSWGGFIIWSLPSYPVAIDIRTDLYGDEILFRNFREILGPVDWKDNPDLKAARLVLLNSHSRLASLMYQDQQFRVVYDDSQAVVFTKNADAPVPK